MVRGAADARGEAGAEVGDVTGVRVSIVRSRFNGRVVDRLEEGARRALGEHGVAADAVRVVRVPGAWELPLAVRTVAPSCDAVVALGCVIRGETPHFDYICRAVTDGLLRCQLDLDLPVGFGVLTTETRAQALARAGGEHGDVGAEAAVAALEMHALRARRPR